VLQVVQLVKLHLIKQGTLSSRSIRASGTSRATGETPSH